MKLASGDWDDKLLEELESKLVQSLRDDANQIKKSLGGDKVKQIQQMQKNAMVGEEISSVIDKFVNEQAQIMESWRISIQRVDQ